MISKQYTEAQDTKCYVEGCEEHQAEMTELERAAAWTTWDYVGTD
jgi:hypothetical protein